MPMLRILPLLLALVHALPAGAQTADGEVLPDTLRLYVTHEAADLLTRLRFTPTHGFSVERETRVGRYPTGLDAPHAVVTSPDGRYVYLVLAHGAPFGEVWQMEAGPDSLVRRARLGRFPASLDISPDGSHLFVVNFNLHGDAEPSGVSVVATDGMREVARPVACVMPHGSRIDPAGDHVFTVCMHSDQLVRVDAATFEVTARFGLAPGSEGPLPLDDLGEVESGHHGPPAGGATTCLPTWAAPGRGEVRGRVYVACNGRGEVLEVDTDRWEVRRRFQVGGRPYNVEVTPDGGLLLVTLRQEEGAVVVLELSAGTQVRRIPTSRPMTHGVIVSPHGRLAFVTSEGVGSAPGAVEAIDLGSLERIAVHELWQQPTGLSLWVLHGGDT